MNGVARKGQEIRTIVVRVRLNNFSVFDWEGEEIGVGWIVLSHIDYHGIWFVFWSELKGNLKRRWQRGEEVLIYSETKSAHDLDIKNMPNIIVAILYHVKTFARRVISAWLTNLEVLWILWSGKCNERSIGNEFESIGEKWSLLTSFPFSPCWAHTSYIIRTYSRSTINWTMKIDEEGRGNSRFSLHEDDLYWHWSPLWEMGHEHTKAWGVFDVRQRPPFRHSESLQPCNTFWCAFNDISHLL